MNILSLDQGTTSSRAIIFNSLAQVMGTGQVEFKQHFPQESWVEHDPEEIWESQKKAIEQALANANLSIKDITAIGITNQRETTIVWDRKTGEAIYPAIVWQDRRTSQQCEQLTPEHRKSIHQTTGLLADPYFSATKIRWILDHVEGACERAAAGELAFGTVESWLVWKLTEGQSHLSDVSNASRTMLMDLKTATWDEQMLDLFNIPSSLLPTICGNSEHLSTATVLGGSIPISGLAGDQQAALFGQLCTKPGMVKNTYGTGCFTLMNTGNQPIFSKHKLLTTVAWKINDEIHYALEGSVFNAGSVIKWLIEDLGIVKDTQHLTELVASVKDSGEVVMCPALTGLGAPYWDASARGLIGGLTRGSTAAHIARAAVESIALQVTDLIQAMESDYGKKIRELRVDGGVSRSDFLMQLQSDLIDSIIRRPLCTEATAQGAAYLAGLAAGVWRDLEHLHSLAGDSTQFTPRSEQHMALQAKWQLAVQRSQHWKTDNLENE